MKTGNPSLRFRDSTTLVSTARSSGSLGIKESRGDPDEARESYRRAVSMTATVPEQG
jgi:hypothetical protein